MAYDPAVVSDKLSTCSKLLDVVTSAVIGDFFKILAENFKLDRAASLVVKNLTLYFRYISDHFIVTVSLTIIVISRSLQCRYSNPYQSF